MYTKLEVGDDFSKSLFGDDLSREFVPRGRILPKNCPQAVRKRFLLGTTSPGDHFS